MMIVSKSTRGCCVTFALAIYPPSHIQIWLVSPRLATILRATSRFEYAGQAESQATKWRFAAGCVGSYAGHPTPQRQDIGRENTHHHVDIMTYKSLSGMSCDAPAAQTWSAARWQRA
jgi:hypothetical protein